MRSFMLSVAIVLSALIWSTSDDLPIGGAMGLMSVVTLDAHAAANLQEPPKPQTPAPQINIEVKREGGRAWYMSPTWMAIGGIAAVLVILLIVLAARGGGGGTTVVRG